MPFHIRLVNRTHPQIARAASEPAAKPAVMAEFLQGIAFGLGVTLVALAAFWLLRTTGFGV